MGATIKDIARRLSISTSTVSYALNDGPRNVPAKVKADVLRVAAELKYRPNRIAKSLVMGRTNTIGLLPTDMTQDLALSTYFQRCFNAILNQAEVNRMDVLVYSRFMPKDAGFGSVVDDLCDGRADGIILIAPYVDSPVISALENRGVPFTVTSTQVETAPCFRCDNEHGVRVALEHLKAHGHKEVGHIAGEQLLADGYERKLAFIKIAEELGLVTRPEWIVDSHFTPKDGERIGREYLRLKVRPTAVFCANDDLAWGFYNAAMELGIRIPADMSIVGFDNSTMAEMLGTPLTSVQQPIADIGRGAFDALLSLIDGKSAASENYATSLVERRSVSEPCR